MSLGEHSFAATLRSVPCPPPRLLACDGLLEHTGGVVTFQATKVTTPPAPPPPSPPCSQTTSEAVGTFLLAAKDDSKRLRGGDELSARAGGARAAMGNAVPSVVRCEARARSR